MEPSAEQLKGTLELLILSVLADGARHGYAVISEIGQRSEGTFTLPEGTVYPALHRLEKHGVIASAWDDGSGRRRRVYSITPAGSKALSARQSQWQTFAQGVQAVAGLATA